MVATTDVAPGEFFNRELSWLEFNRRVLAEAEDERVPLLERVKFLSIAANNLDEFLMVRAGAIHALIESGIRERSVDGLTPKQQLKAIRARVKSFLREMHAVYEEVVPFRVIRNADMLLREEDEVEDLLKSVETELRRRERKEVVWMEIGRDASDFIVALLQNELEVEREDTWLSARLPKLGDLMQ